MGEKPFNLFESEDQALAKARILVDRLSDGPADLHDEVTALVEAYDRSIREQRRLVKVSDRQQGQLTNLNHELARRTEQAEEALAQLRQAQETLIQAEKLASLGALVGGIAHEINTPVGISLSCASHLADSTVALRALYAADDVAVDDFERYLGTAADTSALILANCQRAAALIGSFKQVAVDRTTSDRRSFDLATTIHETLVSLGPGLRQSGHRIAVECPAGLEITGYPGALSQILTNLVMNSEIHAYDPGAAGLLSVTVDQPQPGTVRLVYRDDGKGIPDDIQGRIFDPFFTTRRGAGGTGLGLHIVYNLATGPLDGTVRVTSGVDWGTAFTLVFPQGP
jgi:two-component system, NtrC family, sensor kinase